MTDEQKKAVAVFRHSIISDIVNAKDLDWGEAERLIQEKCARKWDIPYSGRTRLSRSTILSWIKAYRDSNYDLKALYPKGRQDKGRSRAIDEETGLALIALKKENPQATVRLLIDLMNQRGLVTPGIALKSSTVYRFLNEQGMIKPRGAQPDRRKFEAHLVNYLWQSDVMHGPRIEVDGRLKKTYLIAIIDDHSRLVPHAQFYLSEALRSYLDCLQQAFLKRGLPQKLYVDNGPAFRSRHLEYITASLNIALIHARPYFPQGKGKIERWFKTVRSGFLPGFCGQSLTELNEALDLWVDGVYHQRRHGATGRTPFDRFTAQLDQIRPAPADLKACFRRVARRKVAKDRTITFNGRMYEAPVSLIGQRVELLYHENDDAAIELRAAGKSYGYARELDLHVNCRVKRDENNKDNVILTSRQNAYKGGNLL